MCFTFFLCSFCRLLKVAWTNDHNVDFKNRKIIDKSNYKHRKTLESLHTACTKDSHNNPKHTPILYKHITILYIGLTITFIALSFLSMKTADWQSKARTNKTRKRLQFYIVNNPGFASNIVKPCIMFLKYSHSNKYGMLQSLVISLAKSLHASHEVISRVILGGNTIFV